MADAITTINSVPGTFIVNKYDDIDGSAVNQNTARGRLCFRDGNGRMTLPRSAGEAAKAVYPVDWFKPLNPPPYFDGIGLSGQTLYPFDDGSRNAQENTFAIDPDVAFQTPWPAAVKIYDLPPSLYNLPLTSGNICLVYDEGTFTYGSGNYVGVSSDFGRGDVIYTAFGAGDEGKLTTSGTVAVGTVEYRDRFGQNTITVKLKGTNALV